MVMSSGCVCDMDKHIIYSSSIWRLGGAIQTVMEGRAHLNKSEKVIHSYVVIGMHYFV